MDIIIRQEEEKDFYDTELMTMHAFWNRFMPGCDEHLLVHTLRDSKAYLPEISRVAELDGKIVGAIFYAEAVVHTQSGDIPVLTFGPLCVEPTLQRSGIGKALLCETLPHAARLGYPAVIIFGVPEYYPKYCFRTTDNFGITDMKGNYSNALMAYEFDNDALNSITGKFDEGAAYHDFSKAELDEFNKQFPPMEKKVLPGQFRVEPV